MKQRIVIGFLAATLAAISFAAQAQTYSYPNSNGIYVSPSVNRPSAAAPPAFSPPTFAPIAPMGSNPWTSHAQPTVPYSPPPATVDWGQIIVQDYIWNGRR